MLTAEEVVALIPQKPPMVMVDSLICSDDRSTVTSLNILPENIFCENGFFSEAGLLENVAQSAALRSGYRFSLQSKGSSEKIEPPVGFIGGIKNIKVYFLPVTGSAIQTKITVLHEFGDVSVISSETKQDEKLVMQCEMKIFLKKE